ncbi:MAG: glycosyltransferase family 2 protein [Bdellovibrionales bacterium]|nr:glycosyltransferase family 2 protein [Bdellovibrionales bacterium]
MKTTPLISIVSPVYFARDIVDPLVSRIQEALSHVCDDYEIVLVNDGSTDGSWQKIEENCQRDSRVKGVNLSRNFGQHQAITAGLTFASGQYVVVMDCDLQDDPKYIPELLAKAHEGFEIVYTVKDQRVHSRFKNFTAACWNTIFNWLLENKSFHGDGRVGAYSLLSRKVVDAFLQVPDVHRHYLSVLRWLGFPSSSIRVEHAQRHSGRSSYTFRKLLEHAIDGITSQSTRLLRLSVGIGIGFCLLSLLSALLLITMYFLQGFQPGWTSLIVLILLSTGVVLMSMGVLGIYVGKMFEQVKGRPLFLVDEALNFSEDNTAMEIPKFQSQKLIKVQLN